MAEAPQPSISDRALAEAAGWMVRLHGPERTEVVESGWRDWFRAHPDHASAWEVVSDTWTKSHAIPVGLVHPPVRVRRRNVIRRRLFAIAVISAAAMMVVATILFSGRNVVTTVIGEQRTLNLQDGTRIELNTSTRLIVRYDKSTRLVELKSGEAYFSVAHEYRPFVVIAGDRKVIAVGTSFTVRREKSADAMTVTLIEGRVAVAPTSAPDVLPKQSLNDITVLNAGERIRIRPHAAAAVDSPSIDRLTGWMRGQLIFDHTPLREAVQELNRYSATRLNVDPAVSDTVRVSGTFRVSDSISFARAASETYNLQIARDGDQLILVPSEQHN